MRATTWAFLLALSAPLIGCASLPIPVQVPCSPPSDLMVKGEELPALPERDLTQKEIARAISSDTASYNKEVGKRNDLIDFVQTQCQ